MPTQDPAWLPARTVARPEGTAEGCLDLQALLPLFPELLLQLPSRVFTATSLLILAYLGPTMWYLWMDLGTGNANFFYAITLLWAAWQVTVSLCICFVTCLSGVRFRTVWQLLRNQLGSKGCMKLQFLVTTSASAS